LFLYALSCGVLSPFCGALMKKVADGTMSPNIVPQQPMTLNHQQKTSHAALCGADLTMHIVAYSG
jgi:hypothetical protein